MQNTSQHVVIIGAGHGGGNMAALLRQYGHTGPITLVGEESVPPYQRPPLSKAWLKEQLEMEDLFLKSEKFYSDNQITLRLNSKVTEIMHEQKAIRLAHDEVLTYEHLIIATGARARMLQIPGHELDGILYLRDVGHAHRLKQALASARRIGIIGGGYVGLEVAASARALGVEVTVIERESRLLARVASREIAGFYKELHEKQGVEFHFDKEITAFDGKAGKVSGVVLADATVVDCDLLLVGIGAIPNDDLARAAGIKCQNGVLVDLDGRTSVPDVFAIGDVTMRPLPFYDRLCRLESIPNAMEQAKRAAGAISGRPAPADELPWFWSDQYDVKLQIAGMPFDVDQVVMRGSLESGRCTVFHLCGDRIRAAEVLNSPSDFLAAKKLIAAGSVIKVSQLSDPGIPVMSAIA
ncbi:NAD(P)/FAD-dependent oxidoreductase [Herminiimonas contaminans]|uniref:FAD-dependent oxidoreductase n=1 Tax=Herminiimonas contaminans TaxID=1111140 RepID=A0ABS0EUY1_9BURK|nr:FAD-dependent oxidoreductase [Herminiimonas contaminans]MBF8178631.1 FAD-dependent oxidoreductase [Herminiimonas contaminans]